MSKYKVTLIEKAKNSFFGNNENLWQIELNNKYGFTFPANSKKEAINKAKIFLELQKELVSSYKPNKIQGA